MTMSDTRVTPSHHRVACWKDVEELLEDLAKTRDSFSTVLAPTNKISTYDRGRRLMLESTTMSQTVTSQWVAIASIRECWETFERLGRIRREDVLEPGRCSAFMIALFLQVPGVVEEIADDRYLVLAR
jgi:hypothetical protein